MILNTPDLSTIISVKFNWPLIKYIRLERMQLLQRFSCLCFFYNIPFYLMYFCISVRNGFFFFYLSFLSRPFTNHRTAREGGGHFLNCSLPLPPALQTLTNQPGDYCRQLTSAHREQPDSDREPLVSERQSLTTKLRALDVMFSKFAV